MLGIKSKLGLINKALSTIYGARVAHGHSWCGYSTRKFEHSGRPLKVTDSRAPLVARQEKCPRSRSKAEDSSLHTAGGRGVERVEGARLRLTRSAVAFAMICPILSNLFDCWWASVSGLAFSATRSS
jgi:hypothetical protein